jgi:hypothetical protein
LLDEYLNVTLSNVIGLVHSTAGKLDIPATEYFIHPCKIHHAVISDMLLQTAKPHNSRALTPYMRPLFCSSGWIMFKDFSEGESPGECKLAIRFVNRIRNYTLNYGTVAFLIRMASSGMLRRVALV